MVKFQPVYDLVDLNLGPTWAQEKVNCEWADWHDWEVLLL